MELWMWAGIISVAFIALLATVLGIWDHYSWKKKVEEIKARFNLIEGRLYNVLQHNGNLTKALCFVEVYKGNRSANGYINLKFTKIARAGHEREVIIKYETISQVTKLESNSTPYSPL